MTLITKTRFSFYVFRTYNKKTELIKNLISKISLNFYGLKTKNNTS